MRMHRAPHEAGSLTYTAAGVDVNRESAAIAAAIARLAGTCGREPGRGDVRLPNGFFANVLDLGGQGLAVSTDGVGTKVLVAQAVEDYRTVGIDCVAMNVNDVLCVGAEPVALLDYLAVSRIDERFFGQLIEGLAAGAERAHVAVPGGETAQLPELLHSSPGPGIAFDLAGTCIGVVDLNRIIVGRDIAEGDAVLGLASSGIHSNGLTLARRVLRKTYAYDQHVPEFGRTLAEELLEPTRIYVDAVLGMIREGLAVKGLAHITGDGLLNLLRLKTEAGFVIERLPEEPAVFRLMRRLGGLSDAEMFRTFNMGVGFCVVLAEADAERAQSVARMSGVEATLLGCATMAGGRLRQVFVEPASLVGSDSGFRPAKETAR
jgi:phosphoribosylformylglycinamidine cyclo-ligase